MWSTPSRPRPQPHWNTAVSTPYAAPTLSRFIAAAFTGIQTDRNITSSSSIEVATTKAITAHSRTASTSAMSLIIGEVPARSMPAGSAARRSATCPGVRASLSMNTDSAETTAIAPSGETSGSETLTRSSRVRSSATVPASVPASTTSRSATKRYGVAAPGPNSSATRS